MEKLKSGYTLPVFACAAAVAALGKLQQKTPLEEVSLDLVNPQKIVTIPIEQVAKISEKTALAITRSEPGNNLDITRHTPVWALVEYLDNSEAKIVIKGGEGIGIQTNNDRQPAIYSYAQKILQDNLNKLLLPEEKIQVTIILPEGKKLAQSTSNAAFGVVEGLSLLGTTGISQPLSAPEQLTAYQEDLLAKINQFDSLVFCIGENGLSLAAKMGINPAQLVKTANWLGPMLVTAGLHQLKSILLFGYHGKLIKLAGGIFHTHHFLADARLEILAAYGAQAQLPHDNIEKILLCDTTELALKQLRKLEDNWVEQIYGNIAEKIDTRSQKYILKHSENRVKVGSLLFDGQRQIIVSSENARALLAQLC